MTKPDDLPVVYTMQSCIQCHLTTKALDRLGVAYETADAEAHVEELRELGYRQAPVVIAGDDHWSGFQPDRIAALAAAAA